MSSVGAPTGPRQWATAVWTGTEMIVWGGSVLNAKYDQIVQATGGRYNPKLDAWSPVSTSVAPRARASHVAVWTGTEMIVWGGGGDSPSPLLSGGRYDPVLDKWTETSLTGAPVIYYPRAVWTGTELIVWAWATYGGSAKGGRYNPAKDTWLPISTDGAPNEEYSSVVWTGKEMIVWGGYGGVCESAEGAIYDPAADKWRPMTTTGAPHPRNNHSAVWTGTQMIVWGGSNNRPNAASYDPAKDAWYAISETEAPAPRVTPAMFFLPDDGVPGAGRMLLWSGGYEAPATTGAIYDFVPDKWGVVAPFPSVPKAPNYGAPRTTVWTGTEMLAWDVDDLVAGVGARYRP
jgi:hypothetical protein